MHAVSGSNPILGGIKTHAEVIHCLTRSQLHAAASGLQPLAGLAMSRGRNLRPTHLHHKGRILHLHNLQRIAFLEIKTQQPLDRNSLVESHTRIVNP